MNTKGLLFILICVALAGCSKQIDFVDEEPFLILTTYLGGANYYLEFYPRNIAMYNDGTVRIYTEATDDIIVEEDAPTVDIQLTGKEVEGVKETIQNSNFFQLPSDVSDPAIMDGRMQYLTVHTKTESKKVGGEMPVDENFQAVREEVLGFVSDEYVQWLEVIDEYIYEKNPSPSDTSVSPFIKDDTGAEIYWMKNILIVTAIEFREKEIAN